MQNTHDTPSITGQIDTTGRTLKTALHYRVTTLTVPELYDLIGVTKPIVDGLGELTHRVTSQLQQRQAAGGLGHDQLGGSATENVTAALEALDDLGHSLRSAAAYLEDAHDLVSHITDNPIEARQ